MDKTEDLLGIESPLYYRLILIEGRIKRNSLPLFGDCIQVYLPMLAENYLRTAPKKVASKHSLRLHSNSYRLPFRINPIGNHVCKLDLETNFLTNELCFGGYKFFPEWQQILVRVKITVRLRGGKL